MLTTTRHFVFHIEHSHSLEFDSLDVMCCSYIILGRKLFEPRNVIKNSVYNENAAEDTLKNVAHVTLNLREPRH